MKVNEKVVVIIILVLIVAVIATTWAFFGAEIIELINNPTQVTTGNVELQISDEEINVTNHSPIYDQDYKDLAYKKEFKITSLNTSLKGCAKIKLQVQMISGSLKSKYFKWKIETSTNKKAEGTFEGAQEEIELLTNEYFETGKEKSYTLYIWISNSEEENQIEMLGTKLEGKIKVEAIDQKDRYACGSYTIGNIILEDNDAYADNVSSKYVESETGIDFSQISSNTNGQGLYYTSNLNLTEDYDGDGQGERVYYYRGVVENNYLVFAGFCWRIVRTNEDGSVKLRYGGEYNSQTNTCPQTGTSVDIDPTGVYNSTTTEAGIGYMIDSTTNSSIKTIIDNWYKNNLLNNSAEKYIANTIYCNDRSDPTTPITGNYQNYTFYGPSNRLVEYENVDVYTAKSIIVPQYKCPQNSDKFTLSTSSGGTQGYGNNLLTYPIALITVDEVAYAGLIWSEYNPNKTNYLYTNEMSWTMSPFNYNGTYPRMFRITVDASIGSRNVSTAGAATIPVISIKSDAPIINGLGKYNDPYIVKSN